MLMNMIGIAASYDRGEGRDIDRMAMRVMA